ncbi:hypothetical protein [Nonomuraea sp. NPDC050643]|uniref:hypothetical protein n=1 Tax=Nonomuraea sp. NPDC050643 TaxID=3155660 RepID=UPI0033F4EBDD
MRFATERSPWSVHLSCGLDGWFDPITIAPACVNAAPVRLHRRLRVTAVTATVQATPTATSSPDESDPPEQEETPGEVAAVKKKLPDVVAMNLQEGQDTLITLYAKKIGE